MRNKTASRNFVEAESLVKLPHVPLWLSYDNFPATYPQNWQRYVHQYAMALLLYYLSEETDTPDNLIVDGFYSETDELPQEYLFNEIGANSFRNHFIDWAAHMTNHFDFLPANQIAALENEWIDYADPLDENEFVQTYTNQGSSGWYRPETDEVTTAWSFNTYCLLNSSMDNYRFELTGDGQGSEGSEAHFQGQVVVINNSTGTSFYPLDMSDALTGNLTLSLTPEDSEVYFIIASMPETFEGMSQTFSYEMKIEKGVMVATTETFQETIPRQEIGRYNLLGQPILESQSGLQIIWYNDGSSEMIWEKKQE